MSTGERVGAGYAKRTAGMGTRPSKHKKVRVTSLSVCRALGRVLVTKHTQTEHSAEALSRHCTRGTCDQGINHFVETSHGPRLD